MPSTYTASNGIQKPATGEQSGTWGATANTNYDLLDHAIDGFVSIALTGTTQSLPITDGVASNGRYKVVKFTGSPGGTCTVTVSPNTAKKLYWFQNASDQSVIISQGSGATVTIAAGKHRIVSCDGAGAGAAVTALDGITATTPLSYTPSTNTVAIQAASGAQAGALSSADWTTFNAKEGAISAGTTAQYYRGDKTWRDFNTDARAAISVTGNGSYNPSTGVITVNAGSGTAWGGITGTLADQTDLKNALDAKAAASHVTDTGNPHSVTKTQVGLGNVPNTDCTNASNISSGSLALARIASGSAASGQVLKWNGSAWAPGEAMGAYKPAFDSAAMSLGGSVTITNVTSGGGWLSGILARVTGSPGATWTVTLSITIDGQTAVTVTLYNGATTWEAAITPYQTTGEVTNSGSTAGDAFHLPLNLAFATSCVISVTAAGTGGGMLFNVVRGIKL